MKYFEYDLAEDGVQLNIEFVMEVVKNTQNIGLLQVVSFTRIVGKMWVNPHPTTLLAQHFWHTLLQKAQKIPRNRLISRDSRLRGRDLNHMTSGL